MGKDTKVHNYQREPFALSLSELNHIALGLNLQVESYTEALKDKNLDDREGHEKTYQELVTLRVRVLTKIGLMNSTLGV